MAIDDVLKEMKLRVRNAVPSDVDISDVEFEGALLVIYTKDPQRFADQPDLIRHLAKSLQKRIAIRPDSSILTEVEHADKEIRRIIPPEAEVTNLYWEPDTGEVTIEAAKPGIAIGPGGSVLNQIKRAVGWSPKVIRTPPIPSKTIAEVRGYIRSMAEERKDFLRTVGRRLHRGTSQSEWVRMTALGAYREVGRSATMLSTQDSRVLIDCGVKFNERDPATPYIHVPEAQPFEALDAVVVTHAHLDHCGLVPLLFKYGFNGPIYCTAPTRDLMTLLCVDYLKVAAANGDKIPYDSDHIRKMIAHTIPLNYGDTTDIAPDMRVTLHNAGHILGSSIAHFHVGDGLYNIAFTGDIKYEKTWLFNPAVNRFPRLEAIVMESTYGGSQDFQPSRKRANDQVREIVQRTVTKRGKVVMPVFAVGRSQEIMIVLEQLMRAKEIPEMPVYLDGMIWEATAIHTAYPEFLNNQLRASIFHRNENPLLSEIFQRVNQYDKRQEVLNDPDPCVVLATSGMLTGGPVMEYLKQWGPDPRNSLVFVGFQAEGTPGRKLQKGWNEINYQEGGQTKTVKIEMNVETVDGFSGHSDRRQLINYIHNMEPRPERVMLGHGEESKCLDLASSLHKKFGLETRALMNLETVRLR